MLWGLPGASSGVAPGSGRESGKEERVGTANSVEIGFGTKSGAVVGTEIV